MKSTFILLLWVTLLWSNLTICQNYTLIKEAGWIQPLEVDLNSKIKDEDISDGYYYLLMDHQVNFESSEYYMHYAYRITSSTGVQNASELSFQFNPSYQKIFLNKVVVYRNGKCLNKLKDAEIKISSNEADRNAHLYSDFSTLMLILKDIQKNDIVEYAYTIKGENPVFGQKKNYNVYPTASNELDKSQFRVLGRKNKEVYFKNHHLELKPTEKTLPNGQKELIWFLSKRKGIEKKDDTPYLFNRTESIEVSEYESWEEVGKWANEVFQSSYKIGNGVKKLANSIKISNSDEEEQIIKALRFVQNEIRYMGIEINVYSHKPHDPESVLLGKFGDCKDKSLLLVALLREMGFEAYPALVHSYAGEILDTYLPSTSYFNHVIVLVKYNNSEFWFDPTISDQYGNLTTTYTPNYGFALPAMQEKSGLVTMPVNENASIKVTENLYLDDESNKVELEIRTEYKGLEADNIRMEFNNSSKNAIQKNYLKFYKGEYNNVRIIDSVTTKDFQNKNTFMVFEKYEIIDFWGELDSSNSDGEVELRPNQLSTYLSNFKKEDLERKDPKNLRFPINYTHEFFIHLPEGWKAPINDDYYLNESFKYEYSITQKGKVAHMKVYFRTFKNHIEGKKIKESNKKLIEIKNFTFVVGMYWKEENALSKVAWGMVLLFLLFILLSILALFTFNKYKPEIKSPLEENSDFFNTRAIGGWMVIPFINLFLSPFICFYSLVDNNFFNAPILDEISARGSYFWTSVFPLLFIVQMFILVFQGSFSIYTFAIGIKRKTVFPYHMILFLGINAFSHLYDLLFSIYIQSYLEQETDSDGMAFFQSLIFGIIWTIYFLRSERVRQTFVFN